MEKLNDKNQEVFLEKYEFGKFFRIQFNIDFIQFSMGGGSIRFNETEEFDLLLSMIKQAKAEWLPKLKNIQEVKAFEKEQADKHKKIEENNQLLKKLNEEKDYYKKLDEEKSRVKGRPEEIEKEIAKVKKALSDLNK